MSPALASCLAYGTSGIRCGPALLRRHVAKDAIGEIFLFGIAGHVDPNDAVPGLSRFASQTICHCLMGGAPRSKAVTGAIKARTAGC